MECGASDDLLRNLFELRLMIEPQAAELAAVRRTDRQLTDMAIALDEMQRFKLSTPDGRAAEIRFHKMLMEATGNDMLLALFNAISPAIAIIRPIQQSWQGSRSDAMLEHDALFSHIAARNAAKALQAMIKLIVLSHLDSQSVFGS